MKNLLLFLLCALFAVAAYGQANVKDSLQSILKNDTVEAETRLSSAENMILLNASAQDAEALAMNIVYPFVQKSWKKENEQLVRLARLQRLIGVCHRERGGDDRVEKEREFSQKALATAEKSGDDAYTAYCLRACAIMELKRGGTKQAHGYFYQAIARYDSLGKYAKSTEMLYIIASSFLDVKDPDGMKRVLGQMEAYFQKDASRQSQYQYNVIKFRYFWLLAEVEKADRGAVCYPLIDSAMVYIRKNVGLADNFFEELDFYWIRAYAYYFLAEVLSDYYPAQTDTIFFYLNKAQAMFEVETSRRAIEANALMEFRILNNTVRAKALFRKGKIEEAYSCMSEALRLLDALKTYKNLSVHRELAYHFMVEYYERLHRPADALKYQKLIQEHEARRYESERVQAINEMSVKYETEKKEAQIQHLVKESKAAQRIQRLTSGLAVALFAAFLLLLWSDRLKQKNAEQQLYEVALLAELRQNELEKLQSVKRQLKQPLQSAVEKIAQAVSGSPVYKDDKKAYLERLSKLDVPMLESARQSSTAKITGMDMKYIICFAADIDVKDISLLFNVEPASVHTVRYRIRKKFAKNDAFQVML